MYKLMGNDMMPGIPKHQQHMGDAIRVGNPRLQCYMCVCIVQYQDSQVPNQYKPVQTSTLHLALCFKQRRTHT